MTRRTIEEYAEALRDRYVKATKQDNGKMLDEFTRVTGLHRKAAIRLLRRPRQSGVTRRRGRPPSYRDLVVVVVQAKCQGELFREFVSQSSTSARALQSESPLVAVRCIRASRIRLRVA